MKGVVVILAILALTQASGARAALPGADEESMKSKADACRTQAQRIKSVDGKAVGGGKGTTNIIRITATGRVEITCRPAPVGSDGFVILCDSGGSCKALEHGSPQGDNLLKLAQSGIEAGQPDRRGVFVVPAKEFINAVYTPSEVSRIENMIIGKAMDHGSNYDYHNLADTLTRFVATSDAKEELDVTKTDAVRVLESIAADNAAKFPPSIIQGLPQEWADWENVASERDPRRMNDVFSVESQRPTSKAAPTMFPTKTFPDPKQPVYSPPAQGSIYTRFMQWLSGWY